MGRKRLDLRHILIFALLGTMQFCSKQALEFAPNVELVSTLTMVYTLVYRKYALIPILVFILLQGAFSGFGICPNRHAAESDHCDYCNKEGEHCAQGFLLFHDKPHNSFSKISFSSLSETVLRLSYYILFVFLLHLVFCNSFVLININYRDSFNMLNAVR